MDPIEKAVDDALEDADREAGILLKTLTEVTYLAYQTNREEQSEKLLLLAKQLQLEIKNSYAN